MFWIIMGFCSLVMFGIGIYAYRKKEPMCFWAGSEEEVEKETYVDIVSFNHRNGIMWILYGFVILIPPFIIQWFQLPQWLFLFLQIGVIFGGMIMMVLYYEHLHEQHVVKK